MTTDHTTKLPAAIGICPECRWWVSWKDHDECPECDAPLVRFDKRGDKGRAFVAAKPGTAAKEEEG